MWTFYHCTSSHLGKPGPTELDDLFLLLSNRGGGRVIFDPIFLFWVHESPVGGEKIKAQFAAIRIFSEHQTCKGFNRKEREKLGGSPEVLVFWEVTKYASVPTNADFGSYGHSVNAIFCVACLDGKDNKELSNFCEKSDFFGRSDLSENLIFLINPICLIKLDHQIILIKKYFCWWFAISFIIRFPVVDWELYFLLQFFT